MAEAYAGIAAGVQAPALPADQAGGVITMEHEHVDWDVVRAIVELTDPLTVVTVYRTSKIEKY